jgi:hypothetical protein
MKIRTQTKGIFLIVAVWFTLMIISVMQYGWLSLAWWALFYVALGIVIYGGMLIIKDEGTTDY